jgi:hypothetical protein
MARAISTITGVSSLTSPASVISWSFHLEPADGPQAIGTYAKDDSSGQTNRTHLIREEFSRHVAGDRQANGHASNPNLDDAALRSNADPVGYNHPRHFWGETCEECRSSAPPPGCSVKPYRGLACACRLPTLTAASPDSQPRDTSRTPVSGCCRDELWRLVTVVIGAEQSVDEYADVVAAYEGTVPHQSFTSEAQAFERLLLADVAVVGECFKPIRDCMLEQVVHKQALCCCPDPMTAMFGHDRDADFVGHAEGLTARPPRRDPHHSIVCVDDCDC